MESQEQLGAEQWHWATEFSEAQTGSEDELLVKLAAGELPPYVLVWQPGWGQWLPAMHVARLSPVLPLAVVGAAQVAMTQGLDAPRPSVPVSEYPRLRLLARDRMRAGTSRIQSVASLQGESQAPSWASRVGAVPEQEVITVELSAEQLAQAALAMQQLEPPVRMPWEAANADPAPAAATEALTDPGSVFSEDATGEVREPSEEPPPASGPVRVSGPPPGPPEGAAQEAAKAWWGEAQATAARRAALASDSEEDQGLPVRRVLALSLVVIIVVAAGAYFLWRRSHSAPRVELPVPPSALGLVRVG